VRSDFSYLLFLHHTGGLSAGGTAGVAIGVIAGVGVIVALAYVYVLPMFTKAPLAATAQRGGDIEL
jgi:riboflavin transporter FmnP